jgi:hypothetical protein
MSTTTSSTFPAGQYTYFACPGGTSAKCTPRSDPRADTLWFAWASVSPKPVASDSTSARYHSVNRPRESPCGTRSRT